jgi:hypothetical protein
MAIPTLERSYAIAQQFLKVLFIAHSITRREGYTKSVHQEGCGVKAREVRKVEAGNAGG